MKILVTGSTGFIGSALCERLRISQHEVIGLRRTSSSPTEGSGEWNVSTGEIDPKALEGADSIIHLAGENIGSGRWTSAKKKRMYESRVDATRKLCEHLASLETRPKTLVASSAVGFYGDRGDEELTEESTVGTGYLAELCRDWEAATAPARDAGVRVVTVRTGVVLGNGGMLEKMRLPFKLGLGGVIGSGAQYFPWIELGDMVAILVHVVSDESFSGPVNAVAPNSATNREFTKALGRVLRRPTIFPMPAFAARLAFGQMADEAILASTRAVPKRLVEAGFEFRSPQLEETLRHALGRNE